MRHSCPFKATGATGPFGGGGCSAILLLHLKNARIVRKSCCDTCIGDRHDWTTAVPDNRNDWRKFRVVPCSHPLRPLVLYFVQWVETEGLSDYQGRAGIISIVRWNLQPVIFGVKCSATRVARQGGPRIRVQLCPKTSYFCCAGCVLCRNEPF